MKDQAQILEAMKSGGGVLFIGTKNAVVTDYNNRITAVRLGPVKQEDGFDFELLQESFGHKTGEPLSTSKMELAELGIKFSFNLAEVHTMTSLSKAFSGATESENVASATAAITAHKVVLYGHNIQDLPYHDITVTSIVDDEATPTTYTAGMITTHFVIDSEKGTIQLKPTSSIEEDPLGLTFYITGTWSKPDQSVIAVGDTDGGEMDYYSVWFVAAKEARRTQILFIPKASVSAIKTIAYKAKTARVVGLEFTAIQDPTHAALYYIVDENPPLD